MECIRNHSSSTAQTISDGVWIDSVWNPNNCETQRPLDLSGPVIQRCLRNKHLYLLGDVTLQQWFEHLLQKLRIPNLYKKLGDGNSSFKVSLSSSNLNVTFILHPLTAMEAGIDVSRAVYEVDLLDDILANHDSRTTCDYIFVFNPSAQFIQWPRDSYVEMLTLLKEGIGRFVQKCPDVRFVIRGAHAHPSATEPHPNLATSIVENDYILFEMNSIMKRMFQDTTAVWFMDVWDMNFAYSFGSGHHTPSAVIIEQELTRLISHVCNQQ